MPPARSPSTDCRRRTSRRTASPRPCRYWPAWAGCLQQALGVTVDRVIGPQTIGAAARANQGELINEMAAHRGVRYGGNPNVPVYGLGWFRRLFDITARAHRIAVSPP